MEAVANIHQQKLGPELCVPPDDRVGGRKLLHQYDFAISPDTPTVELDKPVPHE